MLLFAFNQHHNKFSSLKSTLFQNSAQWISVIIIYIHLGIAIIAFWCRCRSYILLIEKLVCNGLLASAPFIRLGDFIQPKNCEVSNWGGIYFVKFGSFHSAQIHYDSMRPTPDMSPFTEWYICGLATVIKAPVAWWLWKIVKIHYEWEFQWW